MTSFITDPEKQKKGDGKMKKGEKFSGRCKKTTGINAYLQDYVLKS